MSTLVSTRSEVAALLEPTHLLDAIRQGFVSALNASVAPQRARSALLQNGTTATVLFPSLLPGIPAYSTQTFSGYVSPQVSSPKLHSRQRSSN